MNPIHTGGEDSGWAERAAEKCWGIKFPISGFDWMRKATAIIAAHAPDVKALEGERDEARVQLTSAQARIKELEGRNYELENLSSTGIHTCHDQCQRPLCVARRRIRELEGALDKYDGLAVTHPHLYQKKPTRQQETSR